jgi:hypothetical protein
MANIPTIPQPRGELAASATAAVVYFTASDVIGCYTAAMANVTETELVEMVPGLRAMAGVDASGEVREALTRLAARYAAMASECEKLCMLPKGAASDPTG